MDRRYFLKIGVTFSLVKRELWGLRRRVLLGLFIFCLAGCMTSFKPLEVKTNLPGELPPDLMKRFEVKETITSSNAPIKNDAPASQVEEVPKQNSSLKDRKNKKKDIEGGSGRSLANTPFSYPSRRPEKDPFLPNERMTYGIYYFGVAAGELNLDILPFKQIHDRKVFHIRGYVVSTPVFSLFYRLNDMIETFFDYESSFSHRFHVVVDETKQKRDAVELNDSEKQETFYWNRWERKGEPYVETKETGKVPSFSQDSMSSLYYLRTLPLEVGKTFVFPVVSEGKSWEAVCTVLRKEEVSSPIGKVQAFVIRPQMRVNGEIKNKEDSFLWLSADDRRIPIRLEAKVKVGTVVAKLWKFEPGTVTESVSAPLPSVAQEPIVAEQKPNTN